MFFGEDESGAKAKKSGNPISRVAAKTDASAGGSRLQAQRRADAGVSMEFGIGFRHLFPLQRVQAE
ncbi:MAG: hypothetical protein ACI80V_000467 [Rhodothermales bacterium]|jgi:hypothetical protein